MKKSAVEWNVKNRRRLHFVEQVRKLVFFSSTCWLHSYYLVALGGWFTLLVCVSPRSSLLSYGLTRRLQTFYWLELKFESCEVFSSPFSHLLGMFVMKNATKGLRRLMNESMLCVVIEFFADKQCDCACSIGLLSFTWFYAKTLSSRN